MGTQVVVAGPPTLVPVGVEALGCVLAPSVDDAVDGADAVMALRLQRERMEQGLLPSLGEYARGWGIDARRAGCKHFGRDRFGMATLHLRHAGAHGVAGKAGAHEHDEAVEARDAVPAKGERVDLELELLVPLHRRRHHSRL